MINGVGGLRALSNLNNKPPRVKLTAVIDASDEVVEPILVNKLDEVEKIKGELGENLEAYGLIIRKGTSPKLKVLKGILEGISGTALAVALAMFYASISPILAPIVFLASAYLLHQFGLTHHVYYETLSGLKHRQFTGEPDWRGWRVYEVSPDKTKAIDSKVLSLGRAKELSPEMLKAFLREEMKPIPKRVDVLYMTGHGFGYMRVASMKGSQFSQILSELTKAGEKLDVLILDSCLMSNLEFLAQLRGKVKYVIASEDEIDARSLHLELILEELSRARDDSRDQLKEALIRGLSKLSGKPEPKSLALIDVEELSKLMDKLDKFGRKLSADSRDKPHLREAVELALKKSDYSLSEKKLYAKLIGYRDLGKFLVNLREELPPEYKAQLEDIIKTYERVVPYYRGRPNLTGISFYPRKTNYLRVFKPDLDSYPGDKLPEGWRELMRLA